MALVEFLRGAETAQLRAMLGFTLIAGLANAALIVVITRVAEAVSNGAPPSPLAWGVFTGAFVIYYAANQFSLLRSMAIVEDLLTRKRLTIADDLRKSELLVADGLGRGRLFSLVAKETNHLSVTFPLIVQALQQMILLGVSLIYLLYLSPLAFVIFIATVGLGAVGYRAINRRFADVLRHVARMQVRTMDTILDIIHGAKELRLNACRAAAIDAAYRKRSYALERLLVKSVEHWVALILLGSLATFAMLGFVVFVFPEYATGQKAVIFQLIPILLFCMGTLSVTLAQSPMFLRAEAGLQSILTVERELSRSPGITPDQARAAASQFSGFETISLNGARFSYDATDPGAYAVGPLDLTLDRGEVVFFVGGNGSGKSTALRMLTGLYPLRSGWISADQVTVTPGNMSGYRELFSSVFVDFHLFDRLYGLEHIAPAQVNRLIDEMGLTGKVTFADGKFDQLHLSTGQRKRLAMIAALLEDRPVYVFDEWSAEQDVNFRDYFYHSLIPLLRDRGKLVVVTSHDEKYWGVADRVVKMDLGKVEWVRRGSDFNEEPTGK